LVALAIIDTGLVARIQVSIARPGMAYRCTPSDGMKKLWITSVLPVRTGYFYRPGDQLVVDFQQPQLTRLQILVMDIAALDIEIALIGIGVSQYHWCAVTFTVMSGSGVRS